MKKTSIPAILVTVLACAASAWAQPDRGRVHIQNGTVVADDGVKLRGGSANITGYNPNGDPAWWQAWRALNCNAARASCYRNSPGYIWGTQYNGAYMSLPDIISELDVVVNQASQYGFYVIIDYHSEQVPDHNDWTAFWQAVAPRYAKRTHVLYEMANEYDQALYPSGWAPSDIQWQQNAYQFIRSLAPNTHIITDSFAIPNGTMLSIVQQQASGPNAIDYSNASVSYHPYYFDPNAILALKAQFPVFSTEAADNTSAELAWHETNGISWLSLNPDPRIQYLAPSWATWAQDPNTSDGTGPNNVPPQSGPPSPNGSVITPGQGGSLVTSEGTWTFGGLAPDGVNYYTQLNGNANGWAVKLEIANGNLYAFNKVDGDWWLRQNGTWVDAGTTDPLGSPSFSPDGSVIHAGQGGSLITSQGTWTFGSATIDGAGDYATQLNGVANGAAVQLQITNGHVYAYAKWDGTWWLWQNNTWADAGTTAPGGGANLIQDPNYTQQTQGNGNPLIAPWSGTGPATMGLDSNNGNGPSPTPCAYIFDPGTGAWSAITQTVTVNANTNYTLSAIIQTSSPFPAGSLGVQTPDGTVLAQQAFAEQDNYSQVTVSFNSGSATTLTVFAGFTGYSGVAAWIHADNWSMVDPPGAKSASTSVAGPTSAASLGGGKAACGLTGLETVLVLGLLALRRRRT